MPCAVGSSYVIVDVTPHDCMDAGGSTQGHKSNAGASCREWLITEPENMVSYG